MSGERYLVVVPEQGSEPWWRDRLTGVGRAHGLGLINGKGFLLLSEAQPLLLGEIEQPVGAIVGTIFGYVGGAALTRLPDREALAALTTRGASLVDNYWGDYVAIIGDGGAPTILRAPFGDLPCFVRRSADANHGRLASPAP